VRTDYSADVARELFEQWQYLPHDCRQPGAWTMTIGEADRGDWQWKEEGLLRNRN